MPVQVVVQSVVIVPSVSPPASSIGLTIEPVSVAHLGLARDAYLRYGKGMNVAGLNYADCFSYALAKDSGEPLLFKGDDFTHTDITAC